jgi:uncharacterized membrane protein
MPRKFSWNNNFKQFKIKIMKKLIIYSVVAISIFLNTDLNAQNANTKPIPSMKQLWTLEQVKAMAKKYNYQDSISEKKNNLLLYMTKEQIEEHLSSEFNIKEYRKEMNTYLANTKNVKNYDDFLKLINSLPRVKKQLVKLEGGEASFEKKINDAKQYKWRIYRNPEGALSFFRADTKIITSELKNGKRIDNLPQSKN